MQPLDAFERELRAYHEDLIRRTVERERARRAAVKVPRQPRKRSTKRKPRITAASTVRRLAERAGGIGPAAQMLALSPRTVRRWERSGAPASAEWRIRDWRGQLDLQAATRKLHSSALELHLQTALVNGMLPERQQPNEREVSTYRRVGRYRARTWPWPDVSKASKASKALRAWAAKPLGDWPNWQLCIGYAIFGYLPGGEADAANAGYRGGKNVAWQPEYVGDQLPFEEEIVVDSWWNSPVRATHAEVLTDLEDFLSGFTDAVVARLDISELRGFEWRQRHGE